MNDDIKDNVVETLSSVAGVPYKVINTTVNIFYNSIDSELEVMHPTLNNDKTVLSLILKLSVKNPSTGFENIIKHYGELLKWVSPEFSDGKLSQIVKKNGLNLIMVNDNYLQLVYNQNMTLSINKLHNNMEAGYRISFNPDLFKYYKSDVKNDVLTKMIAPVIKMYFSAVTIYSPLFFKQGDGVNSLIKKLLLIIEASFNKKKYEGVIEVERSTNFPMMIELKESLFTGKKIIEVYNVNSIKYRGRKIKAVNNKITL